MATPLCFVLLMLEPVYRTLEPSRSFIHIDLVSNRCELGKAGWYESAKLWRGYRRRYVRHLYLKHEKKHCAGGVGMASQLHHHDRGEGRKRWRCPVRPPHHRCWIHGGVRRYRGSSSEENPLGTLARHQNCAELLVRHPCGSPAPRPDRTNQRPPAAKSTAPRPRSKFAP